MDGGKQVERREGERQAHRQRRASAFREQAERQNHVEQAPGRRILRSIEAYHEQGQRDTARKSRKRYGIYPLFLSALSPRPVAGSDSAAEGS